MSPKETAISPVGIDFGTTNSAIASALPDSGGKIVPRAVAHDSYSPRIATAVYITEDKEYLVGEDALVAAATDPARLYTEFKRNLDPDGDHLKPLPDGTSVSAKRLAQRVIQELLEHAKNEGLDASRPVVCHPVGTSWARTMYDVLRDMSVRPVMLSEPEAALYYAHYEHHIFDERNETVLLIDFGGGTCDFLLMQVQASIWHGLVRPKLKIIDEDRLDFAGKDIDRIVRDELARQWVASHPRAVALAPRLDDPKMNWLLIRKAKQVKEKLSRKYSKGKADEDVLIEISGLPRNSKLKTRMKPSELRELTVHAIDNKFRWLLLQDDNITGHRPLLGRKNVGPDDVTMVILAGGSSQLPWVRDEILPGIFPALDARKHIFLLRQPDMAVAYGAALYADALDDKIPRLRRFLQEDLKIELADGSVYRLAEHGIALPLDKNKPNAFHVFPFPRTSDSLTVRLVAGEEHRAADCRPLSFGAKTAKFSERIPEGTIMQMRVAIDPRGEVHIHIARAGPIKKQTVTLFFKPLEIDKEKPNYKKGSGQ